jgi:hypothetical protein
VILESGETAGERGLKVLRDQLDLVATVEGMVYQAKRVQKGNAVTLD